MSNDNLNSLIETKLTKSEAIDLLIAEMVNESERREKQLEEQIKSIESSFTYNDLRNIVQDSNFRICEDYNKDETVSIMVYGRIKVSSLSASAYEKYAKLKEVKDEYENLRKSNYKLESTGGKAKLRSTILKTMLEGSEDGEKFLRLIDGLKFKVSLKLLNK